MASVQSDEKEHHRDSEEEDEDDDEELESAFMRNQDAVVKSRTSVSAEAYGQWNQKQVFQAPEFPKTPEQHARLRTILLRSFLFASLAEKEMETVTLAMQEVRYSAGQGVIQEGDDGDCLYIVEEGKLSCLKMINGANQVVKICEPGDIFGELALLYNCPRAASVVAQEEAICWSLDRDSFNNIVKEAAALRRTRYEGFLKSVQLLAEMGDYERSQIADALKSETFQQGDVIVKQDETGDRFYIVETGSLAAFKNGEKMMEYHVGDYFGELSLIEHQPRAASVTVMSETAIVLSLDQKAFNKMLGPLQALLSQRAYT